MNKITEQTFPKEIVVTDHTIDISSFSQEWKKQTFKLAEGILREYKNSNKERFIVAVGGASGSSKSTTTVVLEYLLNGIESDILTLNVGQDGYHFGQDYLEKNLDSQGESLSKHKGRYDSFDVVSMKNDLEIFAKGENVAFPYYSRKTHNPISNAISCGKEPAILIFEGLWLLYNEKPWNELLQLYDLSVFFHASGDTLKHNTINRHVKGSKCALRAAETFYEQSDAKNAELILGNISEHDLDFYI